MKSALVLLLTLFATSAYAVNLKPGLWRVDMVVESGGQKLDIAEEMKKRLAEMPPEQRKQVEAAMKQMSGGTGGGLGEGTRVCLTKEMLSRGEGMLPQQKDQCDVKIATRTEKKIAGNFSCKDGTKGKMDWTLKSPTAYAGNVDVTGSDGKKTHVDYKGEFLAADCGDLKPTR